MTEQKIAVTEKFMNAYVAQQQDVKKACNLAQDFFSFVVREQIRSDDVAKNGCALMNPLLINAMIEKGLLEHSILSIGSGRALHEIEIAKIISNCKLAGSIVASDVKPYNGKEKCEFYLQKNASDAIDIVKPKVLMMLWPSYGGEWTGDALKKFLDNGGEYLVFIGESSDGCCGNGVFHEQIDTRMIPITEAIKPEYIWPGLFDYGMIFTRLGLSILRARPQSPKSQYCGRARKCTALDSEDIELEKFK